MTANCDSGHSIQYSLVLVKQATPVYYAQVTSTLQISEQDVPIPDQIKDSIETWIDILGSESAAAQGLKQPITSSLILRNGSLRINSPIKFTDWIYLLISLDETVNDEGQFGLSDKESNSKENVFTPVGFLRFGKRSLFLSDPSVNQTLVRVKDATCALDFYLRQQRKGLGCFLMKQMISFLSIKSPEQIAFDKPTEAMIAFLLKNFNLESPIQQANNFVIFPGFFNFVSTDGP